MALPLAGAILLHDGESSTVHRIGDRVVKTYKDTWRHLGDYEREVRFYQLAPLRCWTPWGEPSGADRSLRMDWGGECVTAANLPKHWRSTAPNLLADLAINRLQHNDIRPENILVQDHHLALIDWQWWTPLGIVPPRDWPPRLGGAWRAGGLDRWEFDDRVSLFRSLEAVERGEAEPRLPGAP